MKARPKLIKAEELFSVAGKVVLITGAGGLGEVLAEGYAANGALVSIADARPEKGAEVAAALSDKGYSGCTGYDMDQTDKSQCEAVVDAVLAEHGRIDVLVNTAGIGECFPAEDFDEEVMRRIVDVNLTSAMLITQAVAKRAMIPAGNGKIIEIGSIAGVMTHTYESFVYEATKAGIHQMVKSLAIAWGKHNINVNSIAPTWIMTPMLDGEPQDYFDQIDAMHPFERMAEAADFIGPAIFLSSAASDFVTGHTLLVDGGWCAGRPLVYDKDDPRIVHFD